MNKFEGLIFDLDGVLVDTAKYHFLAWQRLAAEFNFEFTHEHNEGLKGIRRKEALEKIISLANISLSNDEKVRFMKRKNDWYLEFIDRMSPDEVLPGVIPFLKSAKADGFKMALGSASKNAIRILKILGIQDLFDVIIDGNVVTRSKPDPEVFLRGAEGLEISPSACIVFEDAVAGIEAAKNANMKAVGIGDPKTLGKADLVFPGFENVDLTKDIIENI